ncbi:MAG: amino acid ABC transporter permease [Oscillospiraceae bacterium]|jgi:polar amino acid transport system permease protein|nr:amino acid ABC transporter permease [Oscillospiraceae bacterium]
MEIFSDVRNILRLLSGLWVTLRISLTAVGLSVPFGVAFGLLMTWKNPVCKVLSRIILEFVRIMPQLVLLFLAYFGVTRAFGWNLSGGTASVIVFAVWGTAELGDLTRGAIASIPKHQFESAYALGLSKLHVYLNVILPQTVRRLIPPAINLVTRMIKTTSLVVLIGVVEVLKVGQQIIEANRYTFPKAAVAVYLVIFFLYFAACYPISLAAKKLEKRMNG